MDANQHRPPHVAMVPTPGMGHLIPLVELAKRLVSRHRLEATIIIPNDGSLTESTENLLKSLPDSISAVFLPPVSLSDIPTAAKIEIRIYLTMTRSLPALRNWLRLITESTRLVALVVDLFGVDAFDFAKDFKIPCFLFFPSTAMCLSWGFYVPKLDRTYSGEYKDLPEPVRLPGCVPVRGPDLTDPVHERNDPAYECFLHLCRNYSRADGIMVNSFMDLEPGAFSSLMGGGLEGVPPVYPVGPLVRAVDDVGYECLKWLDDKPCGSVLFVCFGSGGTLSHEQIIELAFGLEMSGQRFVWVIRKPSEKSTNDSYFGETTQKEMILSYLPDGFLEKTKGVGLVVPSWAPQAKILGHVSTGGFLSHCGWNSTLESIVNGVPLIAWPLFAEQRMNAVMLTEGLNVAFRVEHNKNGLVSREEIAKHARELIEGEGGKKLKEKMKELKEAALLAVDEDGSSTKSNEEVVEFWNRWKLLK